MQKALHEAKSPLRSRLEMQLSNYFDIAKHNYKLIGDVWFDFRI